MLVLILHIILIIVVLWIVVYTIRHYVFTLNRLFGKQRYPYLDVDTATWPTVTVFVPAHNEERVIGNALEALVNVHYPREKLRIVVVNDRSTDQTRAILDHYAAQFPDLVFPYHRDTGKPGKPAALKEVSAQITSEILIMFDADYIPGRGLIKQLAAPFFDPQVGAVMGRVVPVNTEQNLLTRLLGLERSGGYQVDQQARMNMNLIPQFGGTVGGVRMVALDSVGGWRENTLAEDTDLTYRLLLKGWKTVYQNRTECYEEAPERWDVRVKQIMRWAMGHNQALYRYFLPVLTSRRLTRWEKLDGALLLGVYVMSPVVFIGWIVAILLFYMGENTLLTGPIALMAVASYGAVGNSAAFFEICAAEYLDRNRNRVLLLPFNFFNFLISMMAVTRASAGLALSNRRHPPVWHKTQRFRSRSFKI